MSISLLKKLFFRKDYVEFIESRIQKEDKEIINAYFGKISAEKGTIITIQSIEKEQSEFDDGTFTGMPGHISYTTGSYMIHYRCHKKISEGPEK